MRGIVVAGIGTDVGKTVVSAVLCELLSASYWKPVASGAEDGPEESATVASLIRNGQYRVYGERYLFGRSLSPHVAAALEGVEVNLDELTLPTCSEPVVVELAGGIMVPLNDRATNLDLMERLNLPVVVVSHHYLGSINHTLLTLSALRSRGISVAGVIFNGDELPDTERIIATLGNVRVIGRMPWIEPLTQDAVTSCAMTSGWSI